MRPYIHPRLVPLRWLLGATVIATAAVSCFQEPDGDVTFACDPIAAPACPEGYACQADGCCHKEGSPYLENEGACRLGGEDDGAPGDTGETGTGSGSDTETGGDTGTESGTTG